MYQVEFHKACYKGVFISNSLHSVSLTSQNKIVYSTPRNKWRHSPDRRGIWREEKRQPELPGENFSEQGRDTNNLLNPNITSIPRIESERDYWWEANVHTTVAFNLCISCREKW